MELKIEWKETSLPPFTATILLWVFSTLEIRRAIFRKAHFSVMGRNKQQVSLCICNTLQLLTATVFLSSPLEMSGVSSKQSEKD